MINKDKIFAYLTENPGEQFDAETIGERLNMRRNAASALLNELAREGRIQKQKTRPAMFGIGEKKEEAAVPSAESAAQEDSLDTLAGFGRSMKAELEKCRIVATYPGRGLPVMLLGESGVGKSTLARQIYEYSVKKGLLPEKAPFQVLNCADYYNNREMLSAVLFGYKKGAFTGADRDTVGVIEKADGGYLFLDEVHRLPEEGQEKLFRYMDYGVISRFGAGGEERRVNVRLIFATTENAGEVMLDTFMRRVPLTVHLKSFPERSLGERMEIVQRLFEEESAVLKRELSVKSEVLEALAGFRGKGNIGTLKNHIKIICARAYEKGGSGILEIGMQSIRGLEVDALSPGSAGPGTDLAPALLIRPGGSRSRCGRVIKENLESQMEIDKLLDQTEQYSQGRVSRKEWQRQLSRRVEKLAAFFADEPEDPELIGIRRYVSLALEFMRTTYGVSSGKVHQDFLSHLVLNMCEGAENTGEGTEEKTARKLRRALQKKLGRAMRLGDRFLSWLAEHSPYHVRNDAGWIGVGLYFYFLSPDQGGVCSALVVMHGKGVASGIAGLVNYIYSQYLMDYIEMEVSASYEDIRQQVLGWLNQVDAAQNVLIMMDMGSLADLERDLQPLILGEFGLIDNVTTRAAIDLGGMLAQRQPLESALQKVTGENQSRYWFSGKKNRPKAIVVCCISGIGTAVKMGGLLDSCLTEEDQIRVIPHEYADLRENGRESAVFQSYQVLFVISTVSLAVAGIPVLLLNDLMDRKGQQVIERELGEHMTPRRVKTFLNELVKNFSLRNIISQLSILNPERIIEEVDAQLKALERMLSREIPLHVKRMLFVHSSVLIERLITEPPYTLTEMDRIFRKDHEEFTEMVEASFSVIEKKYNVSINDREIRMIYDILASEPGVLEGL